MLSVVATAISRSVTSMTKMSIDRGRPSPSRTTYGITSAGTV